MGQNRGQSFGLGDEVKIKVAAVNLDDRKIDFELIQQLSHAGRAIRSRAPRVAKTQTTEQVFSERPAKSTEKTDVKRQVSEDGEKPVRKKKEKAKRSSFDKKPSKKSSAKPETKAKDKVKKKAKAKKKKSNAKASDE